MQRVKQMHSGKPAFAFDSVWQVSLVNPFGTGRERGGGASTAGGGGRLHSKNAYMNMNVLIASNDLDVYQLVRDIIEIIYKGAVIDRALDTGKLADRLDDESVMYNLILTDRRFSDADDGDIIAFMRRTYPRFLDRTVVVLDADDRGGAEDLEDLPAVYKPFSLDEFDEVVRKATVTDSTAP
jgi:hypothetical protein